MRVNKRQKSGEEFFGAGGPTRTGDLLITNQLLYQLSYTSTIGEKKSAHYSAAESAAARAVTEFTHMALRNAVCSAIAAAGRRGCRSERRLP